MVRWGRWPHQYLPRLIDWRSRGSRIKKQNKKRGSDSFSSFHHKRYLLETDYWRSFFRDFNAKIYLTNHVYFERHIAAHAALAERGGISAIFQESYREFSAPVAMVHTDIYFGFSPHIKDIEVGNGSTFSYFVSTGYIGDYKFSLAETEAKRIRDKLET